VVEEFASLGCVVWSGVEHRVEEREDLVAGLAGAHDPLPDGEVEPVAPGWCGQPQNV
jgi:hypothetical protein